MWRNMNLCALVGIQIDEATVEKSMEVSQKN